MRHRLGWSRLVLGRRSDCPRRQIDRRASGTVSAGTLEGLWVATRRLAASDYQKRIPCPPGQSSLQTSVDWSITSMRIALAGELAK